MATISTSLFTNSPVNMGDTNLVPFASNLTATATKFSWLSGFGSANAVFIHGSAFSYSGSGNARELAGGSISKIVIDSGNDNGSETAGDLVITGTEGLIAANIRKGDTQSFWSEILKGDDTFNLFGLGEDDIGLGFSSAFGDDFSCISGPGSKTDTGGNDQMFGADNEITMIGDVISVAGTTGGDFIIPATYTGGDDRISGATSDRRNNLVGDALLVSRFGEVIGGDDVIDCSRNSNVSTSVTGDVDNLHNEGFVRGGADSISLGSAGAGTGDVLFMLGTGGFVIGGDDTIDGVKLDCGGDVFRVVSTVNNAIIQCGSDRITGGSLDDRMSGDILFRDSVSNTVAGGADVLVGGDGNDQLFGEVGIGSLTGVSGGNDRLMGGRGNDRLFGQTGDDRLTGGADSDQLFGGTGEDIAVYDGSGSGVTVNLTTGTGAGGDAEGDTLSGIEGLVGSAFADRLFGDARANTFNGRGGNDSLSGGDGDDVLTGGLGIDALTGGAGGDTFDFNLTTETGTTAATRDAVNGFLPGTDTIDLFTIDAIVGAGNDVFDFIGTGGFTAVGQVRAQQSGGSTILALNTSGGVGPEATILLLGVTATTLTDGDFEL